MQIQVMRASLAEIEVGQIKVITDSTGLLGACPDLKPNWLTDHNSFQRPPEQVISDMACSPVLVAKGRHEEEVHLIRGIQTFLHARLMGIDRVPVRLTDMSSFSIVFFALSELLYEVRYESRFQKQDAICFFRWLTHQSITIQAEAPVDGYSIVKRLLGMGGKEKNVYEQICRAFGVHPRTARKWSRNSQFPKERSRRNDVFIRTPFEVDLYSLVTTDPKDHNFVNRSPNHPTNDVNSEYQQIDWIWEGE